ncbi:hypothetical protein GPECTOR_14g14 [Gonium pectorale]|uniref:Protein kinase domain-containing protein n=1 Tax=Gonium pectorale TaxID=33097 RepID=A0A150GM77_GONPE|nr:hypothetical protein GPECTOR_14g14 [Gonium pectorale]|eukprot:KXZ50891.1 hypothetical protein GPECTOR_14g14 [Gonium pectorale]
MAGQTMVMAVQELCEYGNLWRAIQQGMFQAKEGQRTEHLARRTLLRTASEIARGMIHLHAASVVHGDLKPANVLLAKSRVDRRGFTAKVGDFGLSRVLGGNSKVESSSFGTIAYMAPEAFNGTLCKASDVYAFGSILWEMLSGKRCYEGYGAAQIALGVSLQGMRPEWPGELWPELCALGERCMAQEAMDRPSFEEIERLLVDMEMAVRNEGKIRKMAESKFSSSQLSMNMLVPVTPATSTNGAPPGDCG